MQNSEWGVLVLIVIVIVYIWRRKQPQFRAPQTKPANEGTFRSFERVPSLFVNSSERMFFHCLNNEMPSGFHVMSKVRLEDIIRVKSGIRNREVYWKLRQRVSSRHVDFLIINGQGSPVLAVELDGPGHERPESKNADDLKNGLFKASNIPLKRVIVGENYKLAVQKIIEHLNEN